VSRTGILIGGLLVLVMVGVAVFVSSRGRLDESSSKGAPVKIGQSEADRASGQTASGDDRALAPRAPANPMDGPTAAATPRSREEAEALFFAAQAEHDAAAAALASAEYALDDLEREVDAVERYVDDLRERGEDPARHAEEGMRRLNPVIERYEARLATVEAADAREAEARARLEAAREARDAFRADTP
jgi:hypothetical protein